MSDSQKNVKQLVDRLRTERDELRVRAHLLKAELRDEWDVVEAKWEKLEPKLERLRDGAKESAGDVGAAISQLGEEIAHTYRRLRDALK
jgi:cysteinyl-tRNA synthetase